MSLYSRPYERIASGSKTIELRLYDEKRKAIRVGDAVIFENVDTFRPPISGIVTSIDVYPSFEAMYRDVDLVAAGYTSENLQEADAADMDEYYSPEEQEDFCAVAITFEVVMDGYPGPTSSQHPTGGSQGTT